MKGMTVYQFLDNLVMQPVRVIGRASNMLWIGFGEKVKLLDDKGKEKEVSTYALHIQCRWRIVNKERREILLAASDFYSPKEDIDDYSNFDWELQGNNLFDEKSLEWLIRESPIYVKEYEINMWGDLFLIFTNNDKLEVFITSTGDTEGWRIFECGKEKPHMVARGLGVSFE